MEDARTRAFSCETVCVCVCVCENSDSVRRAWGLAPIGGRGSVVCLCSWLELSGDRATSDVRARKSVGQHSIFYYCVSYMFSSSELSFGDRTIHHPRDCAARISISLLRSSIIAAAALCSAS